MYNQANCHSYIRRYRKLDYGLEPVVVIVTGQHAFKWSVTIQKRNKMSTIRFDNRISALNEFNKVISNYNHYGTVRMYS